MKLFIFFLLCLSISSRLLCQVYTYDNLGRVNGITYKDSSKISYLYDVNGNRTSSVINPCFVKPKAIITPSNDTSICTDDSLILKADSAYSYKWSTGALTQSIIVKTSSIDTLIVIDQKGCTDTARISIAVKPKPTLSATPQSGTNVCQNSTFTLTASGASTYLWTGPNLSSSLGASVTSTPVILGNSNYKVTGTTNGCSSSKDILVTVNAVVVPKDSITKSDCTPTGVTFYSFPINGGTTPMFQWQKRKDAQSQWVDSINAINSSMVLVNAPNGTNIRCKLISNTLCAVPTTVFSDSLIYNCLATAIPVIDGLSKFVIQPNPNNGLFYIQIKLTQLKTVTFKLFNSLGQSVYISTPQKVVGNAVLSIKVNHLATGIYRLQTTMNEQSRNDNIMINQ